MAAIQIQVLDESHKSESSKTLNDQEEEKQLEDDIVSHASRNSKTSKGSRGSFLRRGNLIKE